MKLCVICNKRPVHKRRVRGFPRTCGNDRCQKELNRRNNLLCMIEGGKKWIKMNTKKSF